MSTQTEIHLAYRHGRRANDLLHRRVLLGAECGAQRGMAPHQLIQTTPQRGPVERALHAQRRGDIGKRLCRSQLIEKPKTLLSKRQGRRIARRPARNRLLGD